MIIWWIQWVYWEDIIMNWLDDIFKNNVVEINYLNWKENNPQKGKWFLIITRKEELSAPEEIIYNYNHKTYRIKCNSQLKWYYIDLLYKPVALWISMDNENYLNSIDRNRKVNFTGWLYTNCVWEGILSDAVIGWWNWKDSTNNDEISLYGWFVYNWENNKIKFEDWYVNSLRYINWLKLVWYIDSNIWWVWIIWVQMWWVKVWDIKSSLKWIKNNWITLVRWNKVNIGWKVFSLTEGIMNLWKIAVNGWISIISRSNIENNKNEILSMLGIKRGSSVSNQKRGTISILNSQINIWKVKSMVRKKAYEICRWRWDDISTGETFDNNSKLPKIECIRNVWDDPITVNINYDVSKDGHKILVLWKGVNLSINKSMRGKWYMEVYMDWGNMLISNDIDLVKLDWNGEEVNVWEVTSWAVIKWVYVINGLLWGKDGWWITNFRHKMYIKWSILSLNTIWVPNESRVRYVDKVVWITDKDKISLSSIFNWYCKEWWIWSDGVKCNWRNDKYREKSLILIKKSYNSVLLK